MKKTAHPVISLLIERFSNNGAIALLGAWAVILFHTAIATAQESARPHIGYVCPAGGQQGQSVQALVGGQHLEGVTHVLITGQHLSARIVSYAIDMDQQTLNNHLNRKANLEGKLNIITTHTPNTVTQTNSRHKVVVRHTVTPNVVTNIPYVVTTSYTTQTLVRVTESGSTTRVTEVTSVPVTNAMNASEKKQLETQLARVRQMLAFAEPPPDNPNLMMFMKGMKQKKQSNAQLAEHVRLEIQIDSEAVPGRRELRLATPKSVSEPLAFYVSPFPEYMESEPNDGTNPVVIPHLPAVLNGQIFPGDTDRYRFPATQGQTVLFAVQARALMPYLADAVPGWFKAILAVYDAVGKEIAYADDFFHNPDPLLTFTAPADGDYVVAIRDSIYRGREDFVYRILAGSVPYVTGIFPLGGSCHEPTPIQLMGINLPITQTTFNPQSGETGMVEIKPVSSLNPVLFYLDDLPEITETETLPTTARPLRITLPVIINGRIDAPGDVDTFRFSGHAGDRIVAEIYARRLGSPLDAILKLTDSQGNVLKTNDDTMDRSAGLVTHQADPYMDLRLRSKDVYTLTVRDTQNKGGALYAYRLRVSPPQPDFKARLTPSSVNLPKGGTIPLSLYVQRMDGFSNAITLALDNMPEGFTLSGSPLRSQDSSVRITLNAPPNPAVTTLAPVIVATATVGDKTLRHIVLPCEDMMQAFAYRHLVPSENLIVTLTPKQGTSLVIDTTAGEPVPLMLGGQTLLPIQLIKAKQGHGPAPDMQLQLELDMPPKGIAVVKTIPSTATHTACVVVSADLQAITNGAFGNLIFNAYKINSPKTNKNKGTPQRQLIGTLPAVPYELVPVKSH